MSSYSSFSLLFITIILSLISISILFVVKVLRSKKKLDISSTYFDGFSLYYIPPERKRIKINDENNEKQKCLNGGTPNIKNDTFSECNCPDNYIGPLCQYENLMRPAEDFAFHF